MEDFVVQRRCAAAMPSEARRARGQRHPRDHDHLSEIAADHIQHAPSATSAHARSPTISRRPATLPGRHGLLALSWAAPVLLVVSAACAGGANNASVNLQYACSPPSGKTAYIGATAAMASFAACLSAALGTALQPGLEAVLGPDSIRVMFVVAGLGGFANLIANGVRLPKVR